LFTTTLFVVMSCKNGSLSSIGSRFKIQIQNTRLSSKFFYIFMGPGAPLLTIPGFWPYVSAVVLAAIGNLQRFENTQHLKRLAGFDLNASHSAVSGRVNRLVSPLRLACVVHPAILKAVRRNAVSGPICASSWLQRCRSSRKA
jgi:hypothetical protein